MKVFLHIILAFTLALFGTLAQAETIHRVRSGENLGLIGAKYGVTASNLCAANATKVRNCNIIWPGWELVIPTTQASTKHVAKSVPVVKNPVRAKRQSVAVPVPKTQVLGLIPIKVLNVAPYRLSRTAELDHVVLRSQGWTDAEVAEFHSLEQSGQCVLEAFEAGANMKWMVGAKGKVTTGPSGLVAAWEKFHSARVCQLANGKRIAIFQICENLAEFPLAEPAVIAPPEEPVRLSEPVAPPALPQREEPAPQPPLTADGPPKSELKKELCELDPKLVFGQEHEFERHGNDAHASYLSAALYCTWRGKEGAHGLGAMLLASKWDGHVDNGKGRFEGSFVQLGPSYEYISDNGWDLQVGAPMFGELRERFSEGDYSSRRDFRMLGTTASANWYQPKLEGKEWFYETQVSGILAFPAARSVSHSWQGRDIADTTALAKLDYYANFTVREYVARLKTNSIVGELELYAQLGALFEIPGGRSGNLRIGVAGFERCIGVGAGVDHNFIQHVTVPAWGWWVDAIACTDLVRSEYRRSQIKTEAKAMGVEIDPKTKAIRIVDPVKFYGTEARPTE